MDDRVLKEQLKEMEGALLRLQEEEHFQLNDILANDVFSYVEDALLSETDSISQNMLKAPASHSDTTGWHQNSVLPGNLIMRTLKSVLFQAIFPSHFIIITLPL